MELFIPIIAILSIFVILPGMVFHYLTLWRKQRALEPDDERMLEDLWRSARKMEQRIETLEARTDATDNPDARPSRPSPPLD